MVYVRGSSLKLWGFEETAKSLFFACRNAEIWGVLRHPPKWSLVIGQKSLFFEAFNLTLHVIDIRMTCMAKTEKTPEKKNFQVQLDEKLLRMAQEKAKKEDLKLTQVVRRFLMDYVSNPQGKLFH